MREFLFIFGFETPLQRRNNSVHGWDDENSHGVWINAVDEEEAIRWGKQIAQRYLACLYGRPEIDWNVEGYASFIEDESTRFDMDSAPRVSVSEYPNFDAWLALDRG